MEAPHLDLDKLAVYHLFDLYKKGKLNLQPEYQRGGDVWSPGMKYALIDSVTRDWPIGLVMINVVEHVDDGNVTKRFDVVDGQQRMVTLFGYRDSEKWGRARHTRRQDFTPYADLSEDDQERFDEYRVPIAFMRGYEHEEIQDVYRRASHSG